MGFPRPSRKGTRAMNSVTADLRSPARPAVDAYLGVLAGRLAPATMPAPKVYEADDLSTVTVEFGSRETSQLMLVFDAEPPRGHYYYLAGSSSHHGPAEDLTDVCALLKLQQVENLARVAGVSLAMAQEALENAGWGPQWAIDWIRRHMKMGG